MILLLMATGAESHPFRKRFCPESEQDLPFKLYKGNGLLLGITGIGKVAAAAASSFFLSRKDISLVVNLGAAGALAPGYLVGDVLGVDKIIELDHPGVISKKKRRIECVHLPDIRNASLATRDIPVIDPVERKELSSLAEIVDMEGAAIARVCRLFKIPFFAFKVITDTPDTGAEIDIIYNVIKTRASFCDFFADKILSDLKDQVRR